MAERLEKMKTKPPSLRSEKSTACQNQDSGHPPTRREFLMASAGVALAAGVASPRLTGAEGHSPEAPQKIDAPNKDPYTLALRFNKYLRVTDVTDGLDAVGKADLTLLDPGIRPLWMGMRFWGPAVTMRVIPTNRRMPVVDRKDALKQHDIWNKMGGMHASLNAHIKPGCVIVTSTNGARECGYWGSNNSMGMQALGIAGIVTDGHARDTDEIILQKSPVACRGIGRTIIPGRVELMDVQVPVGCGGVMVRPGDIVGCDWDGVIVVPIEIAEDVLAISARIAVDDKKSRRRLYEKLGKQPDETVDWEGAAAFFKDLL
jgi:4-hydroxy-4-methyl-2-oxoglutarate aldolase